MKKNSLSKCFEIIDQLELDLLDIVHREKPSSFNDKKKIVDLRTKIFQTLTDKEFREYLALVFDSSNGDFEKFCMEVQENTGLKATEFLELFYYVGKSEERNK